ncbi:MAG TPA: hypothetical protein VJT09_00875 [Pyrinomonadaceae bacterium]|nr:hypothetical protein [Pyrinomonadaceae bacterium]
MSALLWSAVLLLGSFCLAQGQFSSSQTVHVYNPGTYDRTRTVMSNRAAMRRVLRRRHRAVRKRRHLHR